MLYVLQPRYTGKVRKMEKEYTIKLNIEISGVVIGENRQEAIEDIDMLDFIDEAIHSGNFTIKETDTKLRMRSVLKALNPGNYSYQQ